MDQRISKHLQKIRFIVVGTLNTFIDFAIFAIALILGMANVPANFISTTCGMIFSFVANRKFTFKQSGKITVKQLLSFFIVTLFALWVIQPLVIYFVQPLIAKFIANYGISSFIAKLFSTLISLTWNYIAYSRFIFKPSNKDTDHSIIGVKNE